MPAARSSRWAISIWVHLGHQAGRSPGACAIARAEGRKLAVLIFEPHTCFFPSNGPPTWLTPLRAKLHALESLGVDQVIVLAFDHAFSQLSTDDFAGKVLVEGMGISHAVAGMDFRYGHKHAGTMETLAESGRARGSASPTVSPAAHSTARSIRPPRSARCSPRARCAAPPNCWAGRGRSTGG